MELSTWSLAVIVAAFAGVTGAIAWFGIRMTTTARDLACETGMGEAVMGALFIGGSTSLSGITTSVTAAIGNAEAFWLALSLVMISILMLGLIYRERKGPGNIGMESVFLLVTYFGGIALLSTGYF